MQLAIISDTHIPEREDAIPDPFRDRVATADHTIHAGDVQTPAVLEDVRDLATEVTAVHGNMDPGGIGLPTVADVTLAGVTFVVVHGTLNPVEAAVSGHNAMVTSGEEWADAIADTARARTRAWDGEGIVGVGGHTHQVEDRLHEGVRVLNPGSATGAAPAEDATMMTVDVADGDLEVTVHEH